MCLRYDVLTTVNTSGFRYDVLFCIVVLLVLSSFFFEQLVLVLSYCIFVSFCVVTSRA